jgi:chemotaxis protein MotB
MRTFLGCASVAGLALAFGACGIPQEQHDAVLKDLDTCKTELASTKNSLSTTMAERNKLKDELATLGAKRDELAQRLGATKKEIEELRKARALAEKRAKLFRDLMAKLRSMIDSGKLKVEIRKGRMIVKMSDKILFDPGRTKLKKDGKEALRQLAAVLKDIGDRDFLVAGHTDNVPIKTRRYPSNWDLSAARAVQVTKFLQNEGVDPKHLGAAGFSEYDPVGDNTTEPGRKSNRRIEIVLMPNIEELPPIE